MRTEIVKKEVPCEVCGGSISAGETAGVHYDYDWDNPDEDIQGSFATSVYRHIDPEECKKYREISRLQAQVYAQHEEDVFHKATY